jgi:hypothetical protein
MHGPSSRNQEFSHTHTKIRFRIGGPENDKDDARDKDGKGGRNVAFFHEPKAYGCRMCGFSIDFRQAKGCCKDSEKAFVAKWQKPGQHCEQQGFEFQPLFLEAHEGDGVAYCGHLFTVLEGVSSQCRPNVASRPPGEVHNVSRPA